jgi:hypothetical protein
MDAILYVDRTGIPWRYLPHDFAAWETVYGYFAARQKEGIFDQLNGVLRHLVCEAEGRDPEPSACMLDIGVDTPGLLPAVRVTAASDSDNSGGIHLLSDLRLHPLPRNRRWRSHPRRSLSSYRLQRAGEVADKLAAASPDTIGLPQRNLVGRRLRQVTWCNGASQVRLARSGPYADQHRFSGLDIGQFHRSTGYGVCTASRRRPSGVVLTEEAGLLLDTGTVTVAAQAVPLRV